MSAADSDAAIQAALDNTDKGSVVLVHRKKKATTQAELEQLSHEELVIRVQALQAHNTQLTNLLRKEQTTSLALAREKQACSSGSSAIVYDTGVPSTQRKYSFKGSHKRHILLKFYYMGWDYQGFTVQEHTTQTIEHQLFTCLLKTCLIESRETSNYHRCGRTDKGVSAFSQVVSIDVRSKFAPADQMTAASVAAEFNYCETLNRVLPANIKCIAWAPCSDAAFSARFDCKRRSYRYFFPRGSMNVDAMRRACAHLVGVNDFRNLCKMDVQNGVVEFVREIRGADIHLASRSADGEAYDMFYMELIGKAYLWHQVRCIMAILLLVGQGHEQPDVMKELLDVNRNPWSVCSALEKLASVLANRFCPISTPQYSMASDVALNLWDVDYQDGKLDGAEPTVRWHYDQTNMERLLVVLQSQWTISSVQTQMMKSMLAALEQTFERELGQPVFRKQDAVLLEGSKSRVYQPLMSRVKCESLENRIAHYAKKRRIQVQCVKDPDDDGETTPDEKCDAEKTL